MSRSGYSDDCDDQWGMIRWRGAVKSAIRGKRGQAFLRELLADLDAMPEKRLVAYDIVAEDGSCCALGCVAKARGVDVSDISGIDPDDDYGETTDALASRLGIPKALAREIVYLNDEAYDLGTWQDNTNIATERRWEIVREWVVNNLKEDDHATTDV